MLICRRDMRYSNDGQWKHVKRIAVIATTTCEQLLTITFSVCTKKMSYSNRLKFWDHRLMFDAWMILVTWFFHCQLLVKLISKIPNLFRRLYVMLNIFNIIDLWCSFYWKEWGHFYAHLFSFSLLVFIQPFIFVTHLSMLLPDHSAELLWEGKYVYRSV